MPEGKDIITHDIRRNSYESKALHELASLTEAQLQAKVIEPLLRSLGFENVRDNSGVDEKGKDLVATKISEFGRNKLYAIQIKKAKLTGRANSKNSLGNLFLQLIQGRDEEVIDPLANIKRSPDKCIFITPFAIKPSVWEKFHNLSKKLDALNIEVVDGSKLLDLIQSRLPNFLDNFSIEVQYRYNLARCLNRITESTFAFGLINELELDNIYVETSLKNSNRQVELLSRQPALLQGFKLLVARSAEIIKLKKIATWCRVELGINDPPIPSNEEEKEKLKILKQSISKKLKERPIKLNLDNLIEKIQKILRESILHLSLISQDSNENDCTRICGRFIDIKDNLLALLDLEAVGDNWIYLMKRDTKPEWLESKVMISASCLLKIKQNIYILGEPGIGKTTLLRRLAQEMARNSNDILPIFLPLVLVRRPSIEALVQACIQQLENQGYKLEAGNRKLEIFLEKAASGCFRFFFDGLDEVGSDGKMLMDKIMKFAFDYPQCQVMVSCRSTFEPPRFKGALELMLNRLTNKQLDRFLEGWFTSQPSCLKEIKTWLRSNQRMRKAATNPLVAALLCSLYYIGAEMPSTEVELYERRFDLLLGKWEQAKGIRRLHADLRKRYWKFITELAFSMHNHQQRITNMSAAKNIAQNFFSADYHGDPTEMIMDCISRGVLEFEAYGGLSFGHLTYQEYLAGRWLTQENDIKFIFKHIAEPWWMNVMRFYAASKSDISTLVRLATDEDVLPKVASEVLELLELAPLTDKYLIRELRARCSFMCLKTIR